MATGELGGRRYIVARYVSSGVIPGRYEFVGTPLPDRIAATRRAEKEAAQNPGHRYVVAVIASVSQSQSVETRHLDGWMGMPLGKEDEED